jgi:hypothetical protein
MKFFAAPGARMPDATGDVMRRLVSVGRERHRRHPLSLLVPVFLATALAIAIVLAVDLSLPAIRGLGFDHSAQYSECSVAMAILPRVLPLGLAAGVTAFIVAIKLGDRMSRVFSQILVALVALASVVALAMLIGNGIPSSTYLGARAADVFLVTLLPVGAPLVVGAVLGGWVAAIS